MYHCVSHIVYLICFFACFLYVFLCHATVILTVLRGPPGEASAAVGSESRRSEAARTGERFDQQVRPGAAMAEPERMVGRCSMLANMLTNLLTMQHNYMKHA